MIYLIYEEKYLDLIDIDNNKDIVFTLFRHPDYFFINDFIGSEKLSLIDDNCKKELQILSEKLIIKKLFKSNDLIYSSLFAGIFDATLHYAVICKIIYSLSSYKNSDILIVCPNPLAKYLKFGMESASFSRVKIFPYFNRLDIKKLFKSHFFISIISLCMQYFILRKKNTFKNKNDQDIILIEATSRLLPYIKYFNAHHYNVVFYSERLKVGVRKVLSNVNLRNIFFIDHHIISPKIWFIWIKFIFIFDKQKSNIFFDLGLSTKIIDSKVIFVLISENFIWYLFQSISVKLFFINNKVVKLLNQSDNSSFERISLFYARFYGADDYCIQHGIFSEPMNLDGACASNYFVWGKSSEQYLKKNRGSNIVIYNIGQPDLIELAVYNSNITNKVPLDFLSLKIKILYLSRSNSTETSTYYTNREEDFLRMIINAFPQNKNLFLTIQPHPRALLACEYYTIINKYASPQIASQFSIKLNNKISDFDVIITTGGTSVIDAIVAHKPCIYINPPFRVDIMGWKKHKVIKYLNFSDSKKLCYFLTNPLILINESKSPYWSNLREDFLNHLINFPFFDKPQVIFNKIIYDQN